MTTDELAVANEMVNQIEQQQAIKLANQIALMLFGDGSNK
ncbi:hypothetical protein GCM10022296_13360 [Secundilactobacillus similis DSM 23365 = JCM 2765]